MTFSDSSLPPVLPEDAAPLVATVAGSVLLPGDAGYDDERAVWNLNHELVPAVIVVPESAADVQAAVTFAARQHRPVLVKTTGHQIVGLAHGAVVIATHRMNDITIDAVGRTARVGAGVIWSEVIAKAAKAGLAPLNGSNPTVGVAGYTLGGGLSPTLGRSHGYAADHVRSLDVVTADGELRHVDAESEPDLFWALRGGKGNFGVVTALEFDLFPVSRLYGGGIYFPGERTADVLRAWTAWHPSTPETMVTSIAVMRMPAMPEVPEPLRGKFLVSVRIAYNGTTADGERMIAPLRAVAPAVSGHGARHAVHRSRVDSQRADRTGALLRKGHHAARVPRAGAGQADRTRRSGRRNRPGDRRTACSGRGVGPGAGGAQRRGDQGPAVQSCWASRPVRCRRSSSSRVRSPSCSTA